MLQYHREGEKKWIYLIYVDEPGFGMLVLKLFKSLQKRSDYETGVVISIKGKYLGASRPDMKHCFFSARAASKSSQQGF